MKHIKKMTVAKAQTEPQPTFIEDLLEIIEGCLDEVKDLVKGKGMPE